MSRWYYGKHELRSTPSIMDGLDPDTEARYRRDGARFIHEIGNKLGLQSETKATGIIYFHRFYMFHSFRDFPRYITACCCLFLAGKVEETPKKCKDIIKNAQAELSEQQFSQFGDDPREEVMTLERILLQTIRFDLQVDNPYRYIVKYAKSLKGNKEKLQTIVQSAWTFVNDSLCTTLCLQWEPEIIAIALMYLASKLSKFEIQDWVGRTPKHTKWWDVFVEDLSIELLEDICHQVLDLYSSPAAGDSASPPTTGRQSSRTSSKEGLQAGPPKVQKTESPNNGRTPPMTSVPTKPMEAVVTPVVAVATPVVAVAAPAVVVAVSQAAGQPRVIPVLTHTVAPLPTVPAPVPVIASNPVAAPPPPPAAPVHPTATIPYSYQQYPPTPVTSYASTPNYQPPNAAVPPPINVPTNNAPKLYPPPLPPPAAARALQAPVPQPTYQTYMQPPPVTNGSFQQNYQQYPPHPNGPPLPPNPHPNGRPPPPSQFHQQYHGPPPHAYNMPPRPMNTPPPRLGKHPPSY